MVPSLPKVLVQHEMTRHLEATKFNLAKACLQGRIFTRQKVTHYWNLLLFGWRISHQALHLDFSRKFPSPERIFLYTVKDNQRNDYTLAVSNYWTFWVVKPFFPTLFPLSNNICVTYGLKSHPGDVVLKIVTPCSYPPAGKSLQSESIFSALRKLTLEQMRGWIWPCVDGNLSAFHLFITPI